MKYRILIIFLFLNVISGYSQKEARYSVGFEFFMEYDSTKHYIYNDDTIFRPMLIHFWYPAKECPANEHMKFEQYIDLISMREDFSKTREILEKDNYNFINAYANYAIKNYKIGENVSTQQILESPVLARYNSSKIDGDFPLIIYAPSNSKTPAQNHIICERLACEGFYVLSVASAGPESIKREDPALSAIAQLEDMEFILRYFEDILKIKYSSLGLLNFSAGGLASTIFQMKHCNVNAIFSMDGSHEYSYYLTLFKLNDFDYSKTNMSYFLVTNKDTSSIYPYYNSIKSKEKYFIRMPAISHFGFVSFWTYFNQCDSDTIMSSYVNSYLRIVDLSVSFFNSTLKGDKKSEDALASLISQNNDLTIHERRSNTLPADMLNTFLMQGIDAAILKYEDDKTCDHNKMEREISILAWTIINYNIQASIKLFSLITKEFPDSWNAYYNLGNAYKLNGEVVLAKEVLLKAQKLNSSNKDINKLLDELIKK